MTFADLKPDLQALAEEDKRQAAAYLIHLLRKDDPDHQAELSRRHERISSTGGISYEDFRERLGLGK